RPRKDFHLVCLFVGGGELALAGAAAVELGLDLLFGYGQAPRAAVHYHADALAVAFSESGNAEKRTVIAGHVSWAGGCGCSCCVTCYIRYSSTKWARRPRIYPQRSDKLGRPAPTTSISYHKSEP